MRRLALLSVSDKSGLLPLAQELLKASWTLVSTGGTKEHLEKAGLPVLGVETVTGFPECLSGRVKTLHPKILGGILFRRGDPAHEAEAEGLDIAPIDVVVVNLYPFEQTAARHEATHAELIEQIDIGGVTLLRAAAKNAESVTVLCDPSDYGTVIAELQERRSTTEELRERLAAKAFLRTATYDAAITEALSEGANAGLLLMNGRKLRYGENPHQWGKYYDRSDHGNRPWSCLQGKELSYLNILDADAAWNLIREFPDPAAACIKHANPSGVAVRNDIAEAFQAAYDADRLSAFGVIVAANRPCSVAIAKKILDQKIFVEVLIAPAYEESALALFREKPSLRLLVHPEHRGTDTGNRSYRSALGGLLVQDEDIRTLGAEDLTCVTEKRPAPEQLEDLLFAWTVAKHAKSNAIVLAKDRTTVGIGAGQTSRVDSVWIAAKRAGEKTKGAVMASDAFFPFPDAVEEAAKHGVAAIIQPGGSVRDAEVIARANALGLAMVTTGVRGFRH